MAEEAPRANSIAVRDESQIGTTSEASVNQQEIARRRQIVRQFFNDFWVYAEETIYRAAAAFEQSGDWMTF